MIDTMEQKKVIKRNLIVLVVLLALFAAAWIYVAVETKEYVITAYDYSESMQKYMEVEVKNPFAKHVFLKCIREIDELEPWPEPLWGFAGIGTNVTVRKGETGAPHAHTVYGTKSYCFNGSYSTATVYHNVPRGTISKIEYCIDLCVR